MNNHYSHNLGGNEEEGILSSPFLSAQEYKIRYTNDEEDYSKDFLHIHTPLPTFEVFHFDLSQF